jgi:hypothetical protein
VIADPGADLDLLTLGHDWGTRQVADLAREPADIWSGEDDVGESELCVGPAERLIEVRIGVGGADEHSDAHGNHDDQRRELRPLSAHVPAQLPTEDSAHHSSSSASTGATTLSSDAIRPECNRTTRSAIRAIAEL